MNQKTSDQGWQQLQAHIEGFVGQALRNDVQKIEYKPLLYWSLLWLLGLVSGYTMGYFIHILLVIAIIVVVIQVIQGRRG